MTTLQETTTTELLKSFRAKLERRHPQAAHDLDRVMDGTQADMPCWLDINTQAHPGNTDRGEPSGPESQTGNDATRAIYQAWQEAAPDEGPDQRPAPSMLGKLLVENVRQEVSLGVETPGGILGPDSWRATAELLRDAALQYLDIHALWAGDALEYRNEPDLHHALWRARRMPALLRDNALQGGPSSPELRAWRGINHDDSSEIRTWFNGRRHLDIEEQRTGLLTMKFCQHMAKRQPRVGWNIEWYFSMSQVKDLLFQREFQKFVRESLGAKTGRITTEDAARLARRVVGDALSPGDSYSWRLMCILNGEGQEAEQRRADLVAGLLGPGPELP